MPQMFYKTQSGELIPMGYPGPKGDKGDPGDLTQDAADTRYVNIDGDTMTGNLTVAHPSSASAVVLDSVGGQSARLVLRKAGIDRWIVQKSAGAESGGNAGSDFIIHRRSDDGSSLGDALTIRRSDGRATLARSTVAADPDLTVATKDYVDSKAGSGAYKSVAAGYAVVAADAGATLEASGDVTINQSTLAVGQQVTILRGGSGGVTIQPGSGVTIYATPGRTLRAAWSGATVIARGLSEFVVVGDLIA